MPIVYLAGPIEGTSYAESTGWREQVKEKLEDTGIKCLSPMRHKERHKNSKELLFNPEHGKTSPFESARAITTRDRNDVLSADVILVNLLGAQKVTIGTMIEFGWADMARKPVVMIMEKSGNLHDHPIVTEIAGFHVHSIEEGVQVVKSILAH